MLLDSRKRDKALYPNPGEFEVIFDEPIRNVCGVEILDTTIPRTMFMTDTHNNGLRIFNGLINKAYIEGRDFKPATSIFNSSEEYIHYKFVPQDYQSADDAFLAFNDQMIMVMNQVDNFDVEYTDVVTLYERGKSSYPIMRFTSSEAPFAIDATNSTARTMLGFCSKARRDSGGFYNLKEILENQSRVCNNLWCYRFSHLTDMRHVFPSARRTNDMVRISRGSPLSRLESATDVRSKRTIQKLLVAYRHYPRRKGRSFLSGVGCEFPPHVLGDSELKYNDDNEVTLSIYCTNQQGNKLYYLKDIPMDTKEPTKNGVVVYPNKPSYGVLMEYLELQHGDMLEYTVEITFNNHFFSEDGSLSDHYTGVLIEYAYFLNPADNVHFDEHTYFSRPIFERRKTEEIQESSFQVFSSNAFQAVKITPSKEIEMENTSRNYFLGDVPLGDNDKLLIDNVICTNIEASIDLQNESQLVLIDPLQDVYFIDFYVDEEFYTRVYLNASVERTEKDDLFLKLSYNVSEKELETQCYNCLYFGKIIFKSRTWDVPNVLQEPITEVGPKVQFRLFFQNRNETLFLKNSSFTFRYSAIQYFAVQSPGLMNLATESYITLRCEEFENHIRGSLDMRNTSPGLGIVNIDVQGYAVNRLEFFSVKYKQFHPIGTLSKMKVRFERCTDGEVYDFKNVDLHMLASIKFLRPKQLQQFEESVLNPEYNPDFMGYLSRGMQGNEDSSTDEDDLEDEYFEGRLRALEHDE